MDAGDWEQPPSQICELKRGLSHHMRLEKGRDFYPCKAKAMFANNMNLLCKCYEIFWQETNSGGARYINEKKKRYLGKNKGSPSGNPSSSFSHFTPPGAALPSSSREGEAEGTPFTHRAPGGCAVDMGQGGLGWERGELALGENGQGWGRDPESRPEGVSSGRAGKKGQWRYGPQTLSLLTANGLRQAINASGKQWKRAYWAQGRDDLSPLRSPTGFQTLAVDCGQVNCRPRKSVLSDWALAGLRYRQAL